MHYPPYHSKYNPIERVWAALENYWKPIVLDTVENTLKVAEKMKYNGANPIVNFIDKVYETGIKIANEEIKELIKFVKRNPDLPLWDVVISPHSIESVIFFRLPYCITKIF